MSRPNKHKRCIRYNHVLALLPWCSIVESRRFFRMRERSSAIRTHQLFQIMSSSKREAIGQPSTKLYSMLFQFYDKYSMHPTHLSTNFHHYIYLLQPRTSRRRSPPQNYPIVTPPCPTPFKHIIPRLSIALDTHVEVWITLSDLAWVEDRV